MCWGKLSFSKERGEVGVKKLTLMNKDLHAKWIWRYENEEKALWRKVVNHKFEGNLKGFFPSSSSKSVGKSLWAGILKSNSIVIQNSVLIVNNGTESYFGGTTD